MNDVQGFAGLAEARSAVAALRDASRTSGRWSLAQVLDHAAQSIEYSMSAFPQLKPALFRATVGPLAFRVFNGRGAMKHPLDAPIPGAPALATDLAAARARLLAALDRFAAHTGPLAPHFAYGALDKPAMTRAHLMHLADHWKEVQA